MSDNVKINLGNMGGDGMGWTDVIQDGEEWRTLVNMILNFQVP
jgi:hypothetical protein